MSKSAEQVLAELLQTDAGKAAVAKIMGAKPVSSTVTVEYGSGKDQSWFSVRKPGSNGVWNIQAAGIAALRLLDLDTLPAEVAESIRQAEQTVTVKVARFESKAQPFTLRR